MVASPAVLGYRNTGKYVAARAAGRLVLGAYAPRSHDVVDTLGCRIVAPRIDAAAAAVRDAAEAAELVPYVEQQRRGDGLRYVVVREGGDGDVLVVLVTPTGVAADRLERAAERLVGDGAVAGVIAAAHDRRDGAILPAEGRSHAWSPGGRR